VPVHPRHHGGYNPYNDYFPIEQNFMMTPDEVYLSNVRRDRLNALNRFRTRRQLIKADTMNAVLMGTLAVVGVGALVGVVAYAASK